MLSKVDCSYLITSHTGLDLGRKQRGLRWTVEGGPGKTHCGFSSLASMGMVALCDYW